MKTYYNSDFLQSSNSGTSTNVLSIFQTYTESVGYYSIGCIILPSLE